MAAMDERAFVQLYLMCQLNCSELKALIIVSHSLATSWLDFFNALYVRIAFENHLEAAMGPKCRTMGSNRHTWTLLALVIVIKIKTYFGISANCTSSH